MTQKMESYLQKGLIWLAFITMTLSFTCCTHRLVDFTVISSKNVPITENGTEFKKASSRVKGVDSKWSILIFPGIPDMKEAIDRAIEKYPGAIALTDGVIYQKNWSCFFCGQNQYVVEGTPLYVESSNSKNVPQPQTANQSEIAVPSQQQIQPASPANVMRITHIVDKSETLMQIATAYRVSIADIIKWNSLTSNNLTPGMRLIIFMNY